MESPLLFLDSSTTCLHAGLWQAGSWLALERDRGESLQGVFSLTESCLRQAGLGLEEVAAFAWCEGPGSLLALRLTAMAINTWAGAATPGRRPVLSCRTLDGMAAQIAQRQPLAPRGFHLACPSRARQWLLQHFSPDGQSLTPPAIADDAALQEVVSPLFLLQTRLAKPSQVANGTVVEADWSGAAHLLPRVLRPASYPVQAWVPDPSEYVRWSGRRHTSEDAAPKPS